MVFLPFCSHGKRSDTCAAALRPQAGSKYCFGAVRPRRHGFHHRSDGGAKSLPGGEQPGRGHGKRSSRSTAMYRALGGGWQTREGGYFVDAGTNKQMRAHPDWGNLLPPPLSRSRQLQAFLVQKTLGRRSRHRNGETEYAA
jgi:hypothetical protein